MRHGPRCGCDDERCQLKRETIKHFNGNGKLAREALCDAHDALVETKSIRLEDLEDELIEAEAEA